MCCNTMKGVRLLLTACAGGLIALGARAEFGYSLQMKVAGYSGTSELSNVPLLVRIPTEVSAVCKDDGSDLQFTSQDGQTVYPYEIDVWRKDAESLVWVKLPKMTKDTLFTMSYGDPDYSATFRKGEVWDDAGFVGVWHMSEERGVVKNSTSKLGDNDVELDAVPAGARAQYSVRYSPQAEGIDADVDNNPAPVGYARYTGAKNDYTTDANKGVLQRAFLKVPSYNCQNVGGNFTISGWYRMSEFEGGYNGYTRNARVFARKTAYNSAGGFSLALNRSATEMNLRGGQAGGDGVMVNDGRLSADNKWVHVAFAFDGLTLKVYANGVLIKTGSYTEAQGPVTDNGLDLGIGSNVGTDGNGRYNNDSYVAGSFDEVRLMKTETGVDYGEWIKAEYDMCTKNDFVKTVGSSVPLAECTVSYENFAARVTLTLTGLGVDATSVAVSCGIARKGEPVDYNWSLGTLTAVGSTLESDFPELAVNTDYDIGFKLTNSEGKTSYKKISVRVNRLEGAVCLVPDAAKPPADAATRGTCVDSLSEAIELLAIATDGHLYVYPGTYEATATVRLTEGVTLVGMPAADGTLPKIDLSSSFSLEAGKDSVVRNVGLTGSRSKKTLVTLGEGAVLDGCRIADCSRFEFVVQMEGKDAKIVNCQFVNNTSTDSGVSMIRVAAQGGNLIEDTVLDGCKLAGNQYGAPIQLYAPDASGGASANGSLVLNRVKVTNCGGRAGAIRQDSGKLYCTNSLFAANRGVDGKAYTLLTCNNAQRVELVNVTMSKNDGYGVNFGGKTALVLNTIIWGNADSDGKTLDVDADYANSATIRYSCYSTATATNGNISADPLLKDDYQLNERSPCINKGEKDPSLWTDADIDLAGAKRISGGGVDMGCYERLRAGFVIDIR